MTNPYDQSPTGDNGYDQQQPYGYNYNPQQSWTSPPVPDYSAGYGYNYLAGFYSQPKPDNMLVWTVLSTVLCCWPIGVFGIYYSIKVDKLWGQGRFQEAENAARTAKFLALVSFTIVVSLVVFYFMMAMFESVAGNSR